MRAIVKKLVTSKLLGDDLTNWHETLVAALHVECWYTMVNLRCASGKLLYSSFRIRERSAVNSALDKIPELSISNSETLA